MFSTLRTECRRAAPGPTGTIITQSGPQLHTLITISSRDRKIKGGVRSLSPRLQPDRPTAVSSQTGPLREGEDGSGGRERETERERVRKRERDGEREK